MTTATATIGKRVLKRTMRGAEVAIGMFSDPSKMPGWSWSIPPIHCKSGAKLRKVKGSTCWSCYAFKGMYTFASAQKAMARRWNILLLAFFNPRKREEFIDNFSWLLEQKRVRSKVRDCSVFRWFDAGDLQSVEHLEIIAEIARRTPNVKFWLPTREYGTVRAWLLANEGGFPENLTVRLSAHMIDNAAPGWARADKRVATSAVHTKKGSPFAGYDECGAWKNDGHCGDCRKCWDLESEESYPLH